MRFLNRRAGVGFGLKGGTQNAVEQSAVGVWWLWLYPAFWAKNRVLSIGEDIARVYGLKNVITVDFLSPSPVLWIFGFF